MKKSVLEQLRAEEQAKREQQRELNTAKELMSEASTEMATAIQHNDMQSSNVAQIMLKAGNYYWM